MSEPAGSGEVSAKSRARTWLRAASSPAVVPLSVLVIGVFYTVGAVYYDVGTMAAPQAGLFPVFVGILLLLASGCRLYEEIARPSQRPEPLGPAWWRVPAICASIGVFIVLLKAAGYLIAGTVMTAFLILFLGRRPRWAVAGIALTTAAVTYYFFNLLGVPLPPGPLPF
ncbi:MAG TPA: tripartite tricarboxylate transporter TctB family protein [Thermodesulfobacteriota bacterium]|nr:tripartite tricarboxylate transporter TctB family protein [Thermodesulfobacteriota bacterium]